MKRYAARPADAPGGAFSKGVLAAEDVPHALRACGLEPALDAKGNLESSAPKGDRLAGDERFLVGLEWTFLRKTLERTEAPRDV